MNDRDSVLHSLLAANHLEQVVSQAKRYLESEPEAVWPHYYLALALLRLGRVSEAQISVQSLLEREPDSGFSHHAAYEYCTATRKLSKARDHIRQAVAIAPDSAVFHYHACAAALRLRKVSEAQTAIDLARQLEPEDPDIIRLYVEVHGLKENSARSAWERIHELESGLALDPNNSGLHESIGDIYLEELDQPQQAEHHYRQSLIRDPSNHRCQRALFQAVARRRFTYRLLSIPSRTWTWLRHVVHNLFYQPWRLIFFLLGFKFVLVFILWLIIVTLLFWPACKLYEWLVVAEIQGAARAPVRWLIFKRRLSRWPFWSRFALCVVLIFGVWVLLFAFIGVSLIAGFAFLAILTMVHALAVLVRVLGQRIRTRHGLKSATRNNRQAKPPPVK